MDINFLYIVLTGTPELTCREIALTVGKEVSVHRKKENSTFRVKAAGLKHICLVRVLFWAYRAFHSRLKDSLIDSLDVYFVPKNLSGL